jgi:hypothetical protein
MPVKLVGQEVRYQGKKYVLMRTDIDFSKNKARYQITRKRLLGGAEELWVYEDEVE